MAVKIARYGWTPDIPDQRDHLYAAPSRVLATLPASADLRTGCPPVYDQGNLGSCTANAIGAAIEFDRMKQGMTDFMPSRLFIYWNERSIEGTIDSDSGAQLRDGIKCVNKLGACAEADWPYDSSKFRDRPPQSAFDSAKLDRAVGYQRLVQNLNQMRGCLADGFPFVFGFTVYESFEGPDVQRTGQVPMPASNEQQVGGHAVLAVGYDDASQRFLVRNSWGPGWGIAGYFTIPYTYVTQATLASDFWTIRLIGS
jgi:C1A family cysteine protease